MAARPTNGRPLQNPAASGEDGFVAAVPSREFRDGTGIFTVKLSHYHRFNQLVLRDLLEGRAEAAAARCMPGAAASGFLLIPASSFSRLSVLMTSFFSIQPRRAICTP